MWLYLTALRPNLAMVGLGCMVRWQMDLADDGKIWPHNKNKNSHPTAYLADVNAVGHKGVEVVGWRGEGGGRW